MLKVEVPCLSMRLLAASVPESSVFLCYNILWLVQERHHRRSYSHQPGGRVPAAPDEARLLALAAELQCLVIMQQPIGWQGERAKVNTGNFRYLGDTVSSPGLCLQGADT